MKAKFVSASLLLIATTTASAAVSTHLLEKSSHSKFTMTCSQSGQTIARYVDMNEVYLSYNDNGQLVKVAFTLWPSKSNSIDIGQGTTCQLNEQR